MIAIPARKKVFLINDDWIISVRTEKWCVRMHDNNIIIVLCARHHQPISCYFLNNIRSTFPRRSPRWLDKI